MAITPKSSPRVKSTIAVTKPVAEPVSIPFRQVGSAVAKFTDRISYAPFLVVALIIAAYFTGSLRTEVTYLKKLQGNTTNGATLGTVSQPTPGTAGAQNPQPQASVPPLSLTDHVRGNRNAEVLLIEYSDLECPFCKTFHPTLKQVLQDYQGKVAWVYRHYPLDFHANAQKEAEASECATELGGNDMFWQYTDALFERTTSNGTGFALDQLVPLAAELGLPEAKFKECLDSGKYTQKVKDDMTGGQAAGVTGTPGTFIVKPDGSSRLTPGALPLPQMKQAVDEALKK